MVFSLCFRRAGISSHGSGAKIFLYAETGFFRKFDLVIDDLRATRPHNENSSLPLKISTEIARQLEESRMGEDSFPKLIGEEAATQLKLAAVVPSFASTAASVSVVRPSSMQLECEKPFTPSAVEVSNIVTFGNIKENGATADELRTFTAAMMGSLEPHCRGFFEHAIMDII